MDELNRNDKFVLFYYSGKADRRFTILNFGCKRLHFGTKKGKYYIDDASIERKEHVLQRLNKLSWIEDKKKPSFWIKHLLWNDRNLKESCKKLEQELNIQITTLMI